MLAGLTAVRGAALFNLFEESLTALVIPHCSPDELVALVTEVLTDFDSAEIANRARRPLAHLLITAARRTEAVLSPLKDLWPGMSESNKAAIAEAVTFVEKNTPGVRSMRLARREDCPIAVQN